MLQQLQQLMSNPQLFQQQLNSFAQNIQRDANPQKMVQDLLNSGKMTQTQFEQYRQIANQLTGARF